MNARGLVFGLNCAIASILALFVAFSFELPNPSWAVLTVYITSQPMTQGGVWGKALYRVVGTVVALTAALIIIPNLIDAPELMILALAAWLGLCLYLSLLDRSPRSYAFMLSGYTGILVALPVITADPSTIFDTAIARTEEILCGVGAAALVHGLFSFHSARSALYAKLDQTLGDARTWVVGAITASALPEERLARRRLASDISELVNLAMVLRFEFPELHTRFGVLRSLEDRLVALLPLLSAVESRREALQELGPLNPDMAILARDLGAWVRTTSFSADTFESLMLRSAAIRPHVDDGASSKALLELSYVHRIALLAGAWRDCLELAHAMREPHRPIDARLLPMVEDHTPRKLHVDHGIAFWSALVGALAVGASAAFGFLLEWPPAINAMGLAAVFGSLFATFDDPTPLQERFLVWTLVVAIPLSAVYVFAILAAVHDFLELALCLFPLYALLGYFMSQPKFALQALSVLISSTTLIGLQPSYRPDFVTFATTVVAVIVGTVIALELTRFLRVMSPEFVARRLLRHGWSDLATMAHWPLRQTVGQFAMRMLDRLHLLMPRAARAVASYELSLSDVLRDLQIGFNLSELAAVAAQLPEARRSVRALDIYLAGYFNALAEGGAKSLGKPTANGIEIVTQHLLAMPPSEVRDRGVAAAVGLRENLMSLQRQVSAAEGSA